MAYFASVGSPLPGDAPCGVDLDSDPAMQAFFTATEGSLPSSFRDFDRKSFDDKAIIGQITDFLRTSQDIRLLTLAAKTFALSENLPGFFETLNTLASLLERSWTDVHPQAPDGNLGLRTVYLQSLEDMPTVLLPLQAAPLIKDKRLGALSFRALLLSRKSATARRDETVRDEQVVLDAFKRYEPLDELIVLRDAFQGASANLQKMRTLFIANASYESAPSFEQLPALLDGVYKFLGDIITERSPEAASQTVEVADGEQASPSAAGTAPGTTSQPASEIVSVSEASAALQAVITYYSVSEPSSPTLLLVRQAHRLVGKSFVEAMQVLAPRLADNIKIDIAGSAPFSLDFALLQNLVTEETEAGEAVNAGGGREFSADNRNVASDLLRSVERFYRKSEPSSPIPLLLERARKFVARDFTSLLEEMSKPAE